jgi:hypothetical protein
MTGVLESEVLQVKLTDLTGKIVYNDRITINKEYSSYYLDFKNINTGIYYLTVEDANQSRTMKLILSSNNR